MNFETAPILSVTSLANYLRVSRKSVVGHAKPYKCRSILVYAECEGLEAKRSFNFSASGSKEVMLVKEKPAIYKVNTPKKLDSSAKAHEGIWSRLRKPGHLKS